MSNYKVIDFYADWCQPCKTFLPVFDKVSEAMTEDVSFEKVNVDSNTELAVSMGVRKLPTIIFLKDGVEHKRLFGAMSESEFTDHIKLMMN